MKPSFNFYVVSIVKAVIVGFAIMGVIFFAMLVGTATRHKNAKSRPLSAPPVVAASPVQSPSQVTPVNQDETPVSSSPVVYLPPLHAEVNRPGMGLSVINNSLDDWRDVSVEMLVPIGSGQFERFVSGQDYLRGYSGTGFKPGDFEGENREIMTQQDFLSARLVTVSALLPDGTTEVCRTDLPPMSE